MNRLNKIESAVFLYFRFSLFLKDPFFQIILTVGILLLLYSVVREVIHQFLNTFIISINFTL